MIFPKTIQDGQAVIRWNNNGTRDIITGPTTIYAPFANITPLRRVSAAEEQFLNVAFLDGHTENIPGPCAVWFDPLLHQNITTKPVIHLDAHEAIVIYNEKDNTVTHRILKGPAIHIPSPTETLHQFSWHGDNGKGKKIPRTLKFEKLRIIPDQMYFDVADVRTADEALITAKLMVFFELVNIEKMLQETHDPIADFINALTADVISFAGECNFEAFKTRAHELNKTETYHALLEGAARIGYRINKVVYRGYTASSQLQAMHDHAIETRTKLVLETEIEHQQQTLTDLKQTKEHQRATEHRNEEIRAQQHILNQNQKKHDQDLAIKKEIQTMDKIHQQEILKLKQQEWEHLKQLDTDLTAVLVAKEHNPDKTIRLDTTKNTPIHLHEAI